MKKCLCLLLATLCILSLVGCKSAATPELWAMDLEVDHNMVIGKMENMSLYPEELNLVAEPLYTRVYLQLNPDGTFVYYKDSATEKALVQEFFRKAFDAMYTGRNYLSDVYQTDFSTISKEDFFRFYTDLYSVTDYDALIEKFANSIYDYTTFGELTHGTYTQKNGVITMDAEDNNYDETAEFTIKDNQLTLYFSDRTEVYQRITEE